MKKLTKLMLTLALLAMGVTGAKAEIKTDWDPSDAFSTTWNSETNTLSWNKNWANVLYTGFAPKAQGNTTEVDLSIYQKIHYNITSLTGTASDADGAYIELKVRSTGKSDLSIKLREGAHDILFKDYAETIDFSKILELTVSATYAAGSADGDPGSAVITEMYLYTDRYKYETQQQTVTTYTLGDALGLASVVSGNTLVSIAAGGDILYGTYSDNQIYLKPLEEAMEIVDAKGTNESTYRFRISVSSDAGVTKPTGVSTLYKIQAYKGDGSVVYTGPWGGDGFVTDLSWTYNVHSGEGGCYYDITPVEGKENTYKLTSYNKDGSKVRDFFNKSEWIFNVIGKTEQTVNVQVPVEVQVEDTEDPGVPAVADGWISLITNGDLAGDDVSSFWTKDENGNAEAAVINTTAGRMNGRGIKVVSKENPTNDWGTQFFIKSSEPLKEGQKLHVEFDYRADKPANAATQVHRNPGDYNANVASINFTVNWQHFSETYDIPANWCKQDGNTGDSYMLSFGMNLSQDRTSNNFYFDNLVFWTEDDPLKPLKIELTSLIAKAKKYSGVVYTIASFAELTSKITAAETALADEDATAESLETATNALTTAINGLKLAVGYSTLTTDMYKHHESLENPGEGTAQDCAYIVGESTGQPYGDSQVHYLNWADLSAYKKLVILVADGTPRIMMNRQAPLEDTTDPNYDSHGSAYVQLTEAPVDGVVEVDLTQYPYAHLNAIKGANWQNVTVLGMYLYRDMSYGIIGELTGGWETDVDMTPTATEGEYTLSVDEFKATKGDVYKYKLRTNDVYGIYDLPNSGDYTWTCEQSGTYSLTFTADVLNHTLTLTKEKVINSMTIVGFTPDKEDAAKWNPANGIAMTQDANNPAIWTAVVDKYIIKNEGKGLTYYYKAVANGSYGEFELPIDKENQDYGFNYEGAGEGMYKLTFTANTTENTVGLAIEKLPTSTVYFVNTDKWTTVKAWVWDANDNDRNFTGGTFPGVDMTKLSEQVDGYDVYSWSTYELGTPTHILISDNGSDSERTGNQTFVNGATYRADGSATVTKTITAAGYATFYCTKALNFEGTGLTAYIGKMDASNKVTFSPVDNVPANTGVLLKGDAGTYTINTIASSGTDVKGNVLKGVTVDTQVAPGIFVLLDGDKGVGFYKTTKTFTVGANTAYIKALPNGARTFIGFDFNDNTTTAIEGVATVKENNGEIYNLQGQRVVKAQKGLYIINGKKVLVK